jgi:RHS repeat-associated protein
MSRRGLAFSVLALLIFVLHQPNLSAQIAPMCDSGGVCGTNTTDPSYGGLLAARPMKQNARGTGNPTIAVSGGPEMVPRPIGSQSYNKVIPILSLPGRGLPLSLGLYYNSRVWTVDTVNGTVSFNTDRDFPSPGFRLDFGYIEYDSVDRQVVLTEADGSKHPLAFTTNSATGPLYDAVDGTFSEFNRTTMLLTYKNGIMVQYQPFPSQANLFRPIQIKDTNRNFISITYLVGTGNDQHIDVITDTLGRQIKFVYDVNNHLQQIKQLNVSPSTDPSGSRIWATFGWDATPVSLIYNFSSALVVESTPATGAIMHALTGCTYPNGTSYKFSYGAWGIVNRIDRLSAPGDTQQPLIRSYETYNFPDTTQALSDAPGYTSRTVSRDGTSTSVWNYAITQTSLGQVTSETVTDQLGTSYLSNVNADGTISSSQIIDGSGKIYKKLAFTWIQVGPSPMISHVTTTDDANNASSVSYGYDAFGNITDLKEFDFNSSIPTRETKTVFKGTPLTSQHILNRPATVQVVDGSGTIRGRTDYDYDTTPITTISGLVGNDGDTSLPRGNATRISTYADPTTPSGKHYVQHTIDQGGNIVISQPDCCDAGGSQVPNVSAQSFFNFDPATQYAYLKSVTKGGQYTNTFNFNPDNGLLQWSKDLNNQQTSFQYDIMYRPTNVTYPSSNGQTVKQTFGYADTLLAPQLTTSSTVNSAKLVQTFDGLGHLTELDTIDTSSNSAVTTTQFQYDEIWRRKKTSNPYAGSEPLLWNTAIFDPLNRVTSIMPPSGGGTSFNFVGNTVVITDPAGKQRKNFFDGLGRLVRVDEPGWGDALIAVDSISVSGTERSKLVSTRYCAQYTFGNPPRCVDWEFDTSTDYDTGTVTATINGVAYKYTYGQNDTSSTVATNLAGKINSDPARVVNASPSGSTISLYAVNPGASGNSISVGTSSVTSNSGEFGSGTTSFPAGTFTPDLTGGENAVAQANAVLTATRHVTTTYGYDIVDHLVSSSQGAIGPINGQQFAGQNRSYSYDGMGRLTSSTSPESGTVTNFYVNLDGSSCSVDATAICRKVDARNIATTFTYNDPLNRITGISYSDSTPPVAFTYDTGGQAAFAFGRVTKITEDVSTATTKNAQVFAYDNRGRLTSVTDTIDGLNYAVQYGYTPADQIGSVTYPSGRVVNLGYDNVGRLISVADPNNTVNPYLSIKSSDYSGAGQIRALSYGNHVSSVLGYNDHFQMTGLSYSTPTSSAGTPDILNLSYDYGTTINNGQIQTIHYFNASGIEDTTRSVSYTYDLWSRLVQAQTLNQSSSASWTLQWAYDRLGNRLSQSGSGSANISQPNLVIDSATNRIISTGYQYDNAGNMIHDGMGSYTFDAVNRLLTASNGAGTATYTYFGPLRIKKTAGSTTVYIYSNGSPIAEYAAGSTAPNPTREYVNVGSTLLASIVGGIPTYYHPDHLSNRAETSAAGTVLRTLGNFPFGETWYDSSPAEKWKFSVYERDNGTGETGLDYAMFRSYESGLARFASADALRGDTNFPQSLNRYSYVTNDPVNMADPTGLKKQKICMLLDNGDESNFCVGVENFLDDPFGREGGSVGSFVTTYIPGVGFVFVNPNGFSLNVGGLDSGLSSCIVDGACPSLAFPTISGQLNSFLAQLPWNNPCIFSKISDGCGLANGLVSNPFNTFNCLAPGVQGPPAPDCPGVSVSPYTVPGTQCSRGCHPEPFKPHGDPNFCKDIGMLGLGVGLAAVPEAEIPLWLGRTAYYTGNGVGLYSLLACD